MVNVFATDEQTADNARTGTVATAEQTRTLALLPVDHALGSAWTNADTLWSSSLDDELAAYREGIVDHWGEYEETLYTAHFTAQQAAFVTSGAPLDGYQATFAQVDADLASALRTHRNTYHDNVTLADQTFTDHRNTRRLADLVVEQAADTLAVTGRAAQEFTRSVTTGATYAQQTYTGTVADAGRQKGSGLFDFAIVRVLAGETS